jgi:hypothetical protein
MCKLQEQFALEDAAKNISKKVGEAITVTDLYRLALEGHLKLSVYFVNNGVYGVKGELCKSDDVNQIDPQNRFHIASNELVRPLKGTWDLTMYGQEFFEIKTHFEKSNSGVDVRNVSSNGILLHQDGVICKLYQYLDIDYFWIPNFLKTQKGKQTIDEATLEAFKTHPEKMNRLVKKDEKGLEFFPYYKLSDADGVLVIRSSEINHFIQSLEKPSPLEKTLLTKERRKLLALISVLLKGVEIDGSQQGVAIAIKEMTELVDADADADGGVAIGSSEINRFIQSLENPLQLEESLLSTERGELLVLISVLFKEVGIDAHRRGIMSAIKTMAELAGTSISENTIRKILKQVKELLK